MKSYILGFCLIKGGMGDKISEFVRDSEIGKFDITLETVSEKDFVGVQSFDFLDNDGGVVSRRDCLVFRGYTEKADAEIKDFHSDIIKLFFEMGEYFDDMRYEIGKLD